MAPLYTVKEGTRSWPGAVFYTMLDLVAINAYVWLKQCMKNSMSQRDFIIGLAHVLRDGQMRAKTPAKIPLEPNCTQFPGRRNCQVGRCTWNPQHLFQLHATCLWELLQSSESGKHLWRL
jgi:hypothetical protein